MSTTEANSSLNQIRIASPCPAAWASMSGDDRVRFCSSCSKHVYDISEMTEKDAFELINRTEGEICGRISRRRDGTVLTKDCPVGVKAVARRRKRSFVAASLASVLLATGARLGAEPIGRMISATEASGTGLPQRWHDWTDWVLVKLGLRPPAATVVMGKICAVRPLPSSPADGCDAETPGGERADDY